ncbi:MAG TPA: alpha-L-fucosidase [Capsulimonadaceae bacterium]|jgi:alpha-L-fucosidase
MLTTDASTSNIAASEAHAAGPEYLFASAEEMQWWRDAKFGLFVHWGPASLGGGDISWCRKGPERIGDHQTVVEPQIPADVYDALYREFNPTLFDARQWVEIVKAAGMKYIVLTAKHHDGFCLWDTRLTQHKSTAPDCPAQRDIVAELADACHDAGIKLGIYYSARDWYHPDYLTENHERYLAFYHAQLLELLANYGKVDVLWFDHIGGPLTKWDPDIVLKMARRLQPGIVINNRLHISVNEGRDDRYAADFDTPEQELGKYRTDRAWESCLCLVGRVWSYKPGGEMMPLGECIHAVIACAGGDGNLLLNTGPMPDGRIEPRQAERLAEVGDWLRRYGESIYGTRGGPYKPGVWGASTHSGRTIYLHVTSADVNALELPAFPASILSHRSLNGGIATVGVGDGRLRIGLADVVRGEYDTVIALEVDAEVDSNDPAWFLG